MVFSVGKKLSAGFGFALLFLVVIGITSYQALTAFMEANEWTNHSYLVLRELSRVQSLLEDVEAGVRGYVITGNEDYLARYHSASARIAPTLSALRQLARDNPAQQHRLDRLEALIKTKHMEAQTVIALRRRYGFPSAAARIMTGIGKQEMDQLRTSLADMMQAEEDLLRGRETRGVSAAYRAKLVIVFGIPAAIVVIGLIAHWITRNIADPLVRLTSLAERVAAGDLSVSPLETSRRDEVGALKRAFRAMAASLRAHSERRDRAERELRRVNQNLEAEVDHRTTALARTNAQLRVEVEERRRADEALAQEHERLQVTLASIGDGVISTDTAGRVVLLNSAAEAMTGWSRDDAQGRALIEVFHIIHEETREPRENPVTMVLRTGRVVELANHTALIAKDGTERVIADSAAPILDRTGDVVGVVLVFRDITEKMRLEEEHIRRQKLDSVAVLAGGIAHDFNNLLTAILGNISLARTTPQSGDLLLHEAEGACLRARDLTQQLLTFAKGGVPIRKPSSLRNIIKDAVVFALRGSNVSYELQIDENLRSANMDAGQINQALNNIVINAKEAMPEGGTVTIQASNVSLTPTTTDDLAGDYARITIADQGRGMNPLVMSRIFEPYFSTKQRGSGLGLATSYSIIRAHDGKIDVESVVGAGTRFTIYLPALPVVADRTSPARDGSIPALVPGSGRILVMDDEESIRQFASAALTQCGYEVSVAARGEDAIGLFRAALAQERPFDLVILDLTVPGGMGGRDCVARVRKIYPRILAVASSGYATDAVMARPEQFGFDAVIVKPYLPQTLSELVADLLHRYR